MNIMLVDIIRIHTLFDISETLTDRNYNVIASTNYVDSLGVQLSSSKIWEFSRNQQRNWDTIKQLLSLRNEPEIISTPILLANRTRSQHRFGKRFPELNIWSVNVLYPNLDHTFLIQQFLEDFNYIPMINDLNETVPLHPACLQTRGANTNIYFTQETVNL